ncbi:hypothetical protein IY145_04820 [Methylosinus sp. H3A]|uniref:hypothetical protein n=1 Tax=Methylosinus sp. H3A TaxID=2785786 RepID=UPI0018C2E2A4|nr:hypothetical protein [Methylosinus sp. H3A]MBG0808694.1 hypothetical protein [Methylosinus sp. H3A]
MSFALIPLSRCAELCGLGPHEMIPGAIPSPFHQSLYESYLMLCDRGADFVRDLIVCDMRRALDIGATRLAAELLLVLRRFLSVPRGEPRFRAAPPDGIAIEAALGVIDRLAARRPSSGFSRSAAQARGRMGDVTDRPQSAGFLPPRGGSACRGLRFESA